MSDVTDADREIAEDVIATLWVECGSVSIAQCDELIPLLANHIANGRIAAERAAVERVVKRIRQEADDTGNREVLNRIAYLLEREGAK